MPSIKNIIIFLSIGGIFVFAYFYFIKSPPDDGTDLVSSTGAPAVSNTVAAEEKAENEAIAEQFINLLLGVKNIKLDDAIFSDPAFDSLDGSHTIVLIPDGNEGRPNPFAPLGKDTSTSLPVKCTAPKALNTSTNTCVDPVPVCVLPKVLNPATNSCVTPLKCTLPKILNTANNTCVNPPPTCVPPKVLNTSTNTCVNPPQN